MWIGWQDRRQRLHSGGAVVQRGVRVSAQRQRHGRMPRQFLGNLGIRAASDKVGDVGVAQRVEIVLASIGIDLGQASGFQVGTNHLESLAVPRTRPDWLIARLVGQETL